MGLMTGLSLAAQQSTDDDHRIEWPSGPSSITGSMDRVVIGGFQDDLAAHAIVLRGGVPVMIHSPGTMNCLFALSGSGWVDLVAVPDAGVDKIAFSDSAGLKLTEYDPLTEDLKTPTLLSADWRNATQLAMADVDGDADLDIVGVGQTGKDILTLEDDGSGYTAGDSLSFVPQVSGFAVGNFDADSASEIAVVLPAKVKVYDFDGTLLASYGHSGQALVTSIPKQGGGDLGVMATDDVTPDEWLLYAFDASGIESGADLEFDFPSAGNIWIEPVSLHPCAADGDSLVDVVVRCGDLNAFVGYSVNDAPPDTFVDALDPWEAVPLGGSNDNLAAVGSLGTGGYTGAITPLENADALYVIDPMSDPVVEVPSESELTEFFQDSEYLASPGGDALHLTVHMPSAHLATADHLQLILWEQDGPDEPLSRTAVSNQVFPVSPSGNPYTSVICALGLEEATSLNPGEEPVWDSLDHHHYYIEAHLVEAIDSDGTPVIDSIVETYLSGFTLQTAIDGDELQYANFLLTRTTALEDYDLINPADPPEIGTVVHVGTIVSLGRLPGYEPAPPRPGTPVFATPITP